MERTMLMAERDRALARVRELEDAIRKHRDERGDDRCWMDDERLYKSLPEGFVPPERDAAVELHNCERFIRSRQHPLTQYVSPQERLRELLADNELLRKQLHQQKLYADTAVEVDGQRLKEIGKANREIEFLRQMVDVLTKRIAYGSDLISDRAELKPSDNNELRIDEL